MDPFIGEIRIFPFGFAPNGWLPCEGQQLQVAQYQALAALLGVTYGGTLGQNFNLPDLRGRVPIGEGTHNAVSYNLGAAGGSQMVTLTTATIPPHIHGVRALSSEATLPLPTSTTGMTNALANTIVTGSTDGPEIYVTAPSGPGSLVDLRPEAVTATGGGGAHANEQPSLAVYYCIAVTGLWPPRS
ncbi:tail fiber protein [Tistrella bauzanensis]|jgi:microcystin-dependent protein|uniref:Tail fiber protein n=1 Tax=Tistrella arctica TaxID=3133430 RepID=A0ABU9YK88_9PROT